jgi:hypothetical protein
MTHLWEAKHDYYCAEGNYYAPGNQQPFLEHESFDDFLSEESDADLDMNLVFRWDWHEGTDYDLPEFNGDENQRNGKLFIFFMGQRKGLYRWAEVDVCRADEPKVIEYLMPRYRHLMKLWTPLNLVDIP